MPYVIQRRGDEWCVFTEENGKPRGSPHGCHATEAEARAQQRALYVHAPKAEAGPELKHVTTGGELKADGGDGSVRAVFSTFDVVDRGKDVVKSSAFRHGQEVPMVWGHDWQRPVGKGTVRVEPGRAVFDGTFNLNTSWGRDAYEAVKFAGPLQEYSWGFKVTDEEYGEVAGEKVRLIKGAEVFEVSPVLVGEGLGTHTLSVKVAEVEEAESASPPFPPPDGGRVADELKRGERLSRASRMAIHAAIAALGELLGDELMEAEPAEAKAGPDPPPPTPPPPRGAPSPADPKGRTWEVAALKAEFELLEARLGLPR